MTRINIDMWPVFDCSLFMLKGNRLTKRIGMSGDGIVDTGIMRNMHLLGFAAERGDLVIFGRPTKAAVAMALGFSQGEWETDMSWPVLLTDEEWQVALSTPGTV